MSYTPLDGGIVTSTVLKEGPDVVACWILLLATCDKLGETTMQPSAAASLMRISDKRTKKAFAVLQEPDPESQNTECEGRRIVRLAGGGWRVTSYQKYQWLASRSRAAQRSRKYETNKSARESTGTVSEYICEEDGCPENAVLASAGRMVCSQHVPSPLVTETKEHGRE